MSDGGHGRPALVRGLIDRLLPARCAAISPGVNARRSPERTMHVQRNVIGFAACVFAVWVHAQSPPPMPLRVIAFDGAWNLPVWAAQRQGFFEANGVAVQFAYTPNSGYSIASLFDAKADIALALIDNLVAYQEGQGEARIPDSPDLFAFMGGDGGFLSVVAAPGVRDFAGLKGRTLSVDAMTTGAAFVLRELLARNGIAESDVRFERAGGTATRYRDLVAGKHDATLLRTPFEVLARSKGYHVLATAGALGRYQGTAGIARRSWARAHDAVLVGFLRGYKAGLDWVFDPTNRDIVEALLVANSRDMTPALARPSYDLLLTPNGGLIRDLEPDEKGIATVLALRSRFATPPKLLTDPAKYVDRTYLERALGKR